MEEKLSIAQEITPNGLIVKVEGRIDGYWSKHLDETLDEALRAGHYQIELDLEKVEYLSSMGIRVLVKYTKQLKLVNGYFGLSKISYNVSTVLEMAGLSSLLTIRAAAETERKAEGEETEKNGFLYQLQMRNEGNTIQCEVTGNPGHLINADFTQEDCRPVTFRKGKFGIGLGAIGSGYEDCKNRFGEFVGLGNVVVYLPSGKSKSPDYMAKTGNLIPEIKSLYGVCFEGAFGTILRFSSKDPSRTLAFSELLNDLFDLTGYESIAMVMLAETRGLVGASLNASPVQENSKDMLLGFPQVRENLNFTTEPEFNQMMTITVGVATQNHHSPLASFVRPSASGSQILQHFHSAVFSYYPLRKSEIDLEETIATFFELDKIQSVLHLMNDERDSVGVGESEFSHGTCWIGKIDQITSLK